MVHDDRVCAECGMDASAWTDNQGQGYTVDGEWYCCQGCAEGTGCTCGEAPESAGGSASGLEGPQDARTRRTRRPQP